MLALKISSDNRLNAMCRVPDSYRDSGCVVLLDGNRVVQMDPEHQRSCGIFELHLTETDEEETSRDLSVAHVGGSTIDLTVHGVPPVEASGTNLAACQWDDMTRPAYASNDPGAEGPISDFPRVAVEVYPRIEGYELKSVLGRGGMGTVWMAKQLSTNREVALKTILPSIVGLANTRVRFQREIELAAGLNHPGLATIYTSGEAFGHYYYSMELVHGVSWAHHVRQHDPSHDQVLGQLQDVLAAIGYAHENDVIHRDLKPSNILIHQDGSVRVVDFGLAKNRAQSTDHLSKQGDIIGTLAFMAPEQASGNVDVIDFRADIYALGVVALSFLTRDLSDDATIPTGFGRADTQSICQEGRTESDGDLVAGSPVAPYCAELLRRMKLLQTNHPRLADVIAPAVALQPSDRYASCNQFAKAIAAYKRSVSKPTGSTKVLESRRTWLVSAAALGVATTAVWAIRRRQSATQPGPVVNGIGRSTPLTVLPQESAAMIELESLFESDFNGFVPLPSDAQVTRALGGKKTPTDFVLHPDGWPLVGFRFCTFSYRGDPIIKCIQPVFRGSDPTITHTGPLIGNLDVSCEMETEIAKPGFVVGAMRIRWGTRVHGMQIRFDRLVNGKIEQSQSYYSPWYGGRADMAGQLIESDDDPIVGIGVAHNVDVNCISLVMKKVGEAD
ncbi:MAG: serine/threonine-protein kinase [Planctomycetota bacterium]